VSSATTTVLSDVFSLNNPWLEMGIAVNGLVASTATLNLIVELDGSAICTVTLSTVGFETMSAAVTSTQYIYSGEFGIGLVPGTVATGTHTIAILAVSTVANAITLISGTSGTASLGLAVGNIVAGSGYNENRSGGYYIPTYTGRETRRVHMYSTDFGVSVLSGNQALFYVVSEGGLYTYLGGRGNTMIDIEAYVEFEDTSSVLQIQKQATGTSGTYPWVDFLVLMYIDIEEGDYAEINYPNSNIGWV